MPSSKQRIEVWRGVRAKTSGGLTKSDLIKNKRGKLVSKRKSGQAFAQNNLGSFLREKGKKVAKSDMLRKKGKPPKSPKKGKPPPKKAAVKPKAKAAVKPPKPAAAKVQAPAKPKPKPKKPKGKGAAAKKKTKSKINPLTQQPYAKKGAEGFVPKVHADNILLKKRKEKAKAPKASAKNIQSAWEALLY